MYFFMFVNLPWALHTERKLLLMEKNAELDQAASKKEHLKTSVEKKAVITKYEALCRNKIL